jgi:FMN reductase
MTTIAVVTGNPKPASRTHGVALAVADAVAAALGGAHSGGADSGGADSGGAHSGGAHSGGAHSGGAHSGGAAPERLVIDLADHAPRLFDWSDPELTGLNAAVAAADVAIFASPTYKASYTGLLKAFLDRYGTNGLAGVTAIGVMTGGWPGHLLAVEVHLRPVLVELGASVPSRGLYVTEPELADLDKAIARWSDAALPLITTAVRA